MLPSRDGRRDDQDRCERRKVKKTERDDLTIYVTLCKAMSWETIETYQDHHFLAELMASPAFAEALEAFCNKDCRGRPQTLSMSQAQPGILLNCSRRYFGN